MVWPPIYSVSLTFAGCPLQLYLLRMMFITLHNSKILLSLHCFLTPQFQTFTNLLIGIFGISNPTKIFLEMDRNNASIIVTMISNITVLQCYLLWIFVSIRRLLKLIVCTVVSTPPSETSPLLFLPSLLWNLQTIQSPFFRQFTPNILVFHAPPLKIGFFSELP